MWHAPPKLSSERSLAHRTALAVCLLLLPSVASAQVNAIISGGFREAYTQILPRFEEATGTRVVTGTGASVGTGPNTIAAQLRRGVPADVVILSREGLDALIAEGRIVPGTDVDLARSAIGMIVRAGAAKPDISSVEAFRQALLRAESVAISTSASGVYLTETLFPRLGISGQMAGKLVTTGAAAVGKGQAELGLQQVSEVLAVPGAMFVGPIPAEVQQITVFAAAVVAGTKQPDAARALIAVLASDDAAAAIRKSGMEPAMR